MTLSTTFATKKLMATGGTLGLDFGVESFATISRLVMISGRARRRFHRASDHLAIADTAFAVIVKRSFDFGFLRTGGKRHCIA